MSGTKLRPNANPILDMMRDSDFSDPWGTAMSLGRLRRRRALRRRPEHGPA